MLAELLATLTETAPTRLAILDKAITSTAGQPSIDPVKHPTVNVSTSALATEPGGIAKIDPFFEPYEDAIVAISPISVAFNFSLQIAAIQAHAVRVNWNLSAICITVTVQFLDGLNIVLICAPGNTSQLREP
uniref:Uncharacterized protein n=1 Tax=Glossina pallidipes TaxID=7398 RepID=A0A1B0A640_GLOPL